MKPQGVQDRYNWLAKRIPGRQPIDDLERIGNWLEAEAPDEAARLYRLADRLRELRCFVRGKGRREHDEEQTRAILALISVEQGRPFEEMP